MSEGQEGSYFQLSVALWLKNLAESSGNPSSAITYLSALDMILNLSESNFLICNNGF